MRETNVAIAGYGAITAVGCGTDKLLAALRANVSGLCASEKFNSPRFQSSIVGAAPRDFDDENPAWFLATEALKEARESSRKILEKISAERIGLVLATTKVNVEALERTSENRPCSELARRHLQGNFLADDLASEFGARGPIQCISTACVSGLIAIQQGAKIIRRGEADAVFVVGVDCLSEFVVAGFTALKAIDPNGCRPFDKDRCGLSPGEAGAAIVLVRENFAPDSSIKIRGWGGSNDANHLTGPSRDGSGLAQAIRAALNSAKLSPSEIDYVNAHGTGTSYNDAMESLALKTIFGDACPPFSGLKGMLGHTLGAAGVAETIACVLAMKENFLPGTPRLHVAAEGVPASIVREPRFGVRLKNVLKLNTGFGGTNGALILSHE
ncbi:MAG TPA: beta-ketoacyl-[acyl-carrier-protein] synthase family protein [Verrucomicrobiae bacterium]|jgi:3-oxoacyl-(acyl-carrier-protein) synthase|nr:beta-ketoacyl-[acyl-carrier-protein] synthase family protein [Verrucomicrobiae bacterium]